MVSLNNQTSHRLGIGKLKLHVECVCMFHVGLISMMLLPLFGDRGSLLLHVLHAVVQCLIVVKYLVTDAVFSSKTEVRPQEEQ